MLPIELSPDEEGFTQYVALRHSRLLRTAYLIVGDRQLAEDVVQSALLSSAKHWHKIHRDPDPYVHRSIVNANISRWRKAKDHEVTLAIVDHTVADPTDSSALKLALAAALDTLTPKQRATLVLRYYNDFTEAQTSVALGVGIGTVKSTTRQALAHLRRRAPHLAELIGSTS